ncbi:dual specificity protein phosphatase family protein [bacterium]|nr:dual specificity protein phosphatase family protein [bacterium]
MNHLHYFEISNIGGCAMPRSANDIQWLKEQQNISAILTLIENPLPSGLLNNFISLHIPVQDFCPPTIEQLNLCVDFLKDCIKAKKKPVVHCMMGYGRTGTILAAYLISEGMTANNAIAAVRRKRPGAIETYEQEDILFAFEAMLASDI